MASYVEIARGLGPEGRVARVTFDRGDRINALSPDAMRQLRAAAQSFEDDLDTSVVVLTGNAHGFSAGYDLKDPERRAARDGGLATERRAISAGPRMCRAWGGLDQVTIAAVEGHCIGGGVALAASLDLRICSASAHFRIPEVALGMNMSWGSLPRLVALMGPARAKLAVILAEERISAAEALAHGLVEKGALEGQAVAAAMDLAGRIAAMPPLPVRMVKTTIDRISRAHDDPAVHMDLDQFVLTTRSEDHAEGVAAFLGKRKPRFRGR